MGENMAFPVGYSIVASISRKENIGANIGIYNSFSSIGRSVGPLFSGYLLPIVTDHFLFWIYVTSPGFVAVIMLLFFSKLIREYRNRFSAENIILRDEVHET